MCEIVLLCISDDYQGGVILKELLTAIVNHIHRADGGVVISLIRRCHRKIEVQALSITNVSSSEWKVLNW
jgi:hypothetical protein